MDFFSPPKLLIEVDTALVTKFLTMRSAPVFNLHFPLALSIIALANSRCLECYLKTLSRRAIAHAQAREIMWATFGHNKM